MNFKFRISMFFCMSLLLTSAMGDLKPEEFINPPSNAKPMTWMHMMNGNASKEGLVKDLQALHDAGVGGALIFSIKKNIADGNVKFNSKEFRDILVHGVNEADRLGLKIGLHNCDGWSSSGGPWIKPEEAMKKVVWSETVVNGGAVSVELPPAPNRLGFYRDIALLAYPVPEAELAACQNTFKFSGSVDQTELGKLVDDTLGTAVEFLPKGKGKGQKKGFLQWSFDEPYAARSIFIEHQSRNGTGVLLSSNDGVNFKKVVDLKPDFRLGKNQWAFEASFPVVTARFFKLVFTGKITVIDAHLDSFSRIPNWLVHASMCAGGDEQLKDVKRPDDVSAVAWSDVQMLECSELKNNVLTTKLPAGTWRIMRFGYSLTGAQNHPATDVGRGLECDKLSKAALDKHFAAYVGKVAKESGDLAGKSLHSSEIDSYEMGWQNWTEDFETLFADDRGFDIRPYLPLVAGRYVGDMDFADAVLADYKDFIARLMAENYFKRFTELCNEYGMKSYIEPYGFGPLNGLTIGGNCDLPMGEFWMDQKPGTHYHTPVHAAHTYGKSVVSAESFTSWKDLNWKIHPWLMKPSGDYAWSQGINEFMFHRFAHQSNPHVVPGMTMGSIGSHIDRTQTWWLNAGKAWMKYNQRGSFLLRQGVPVADLLVYAGDRSPQKAVSYSSAGLPVGYNMDSCDFFVLNNRINVQNGKMVLPEGTSYSILQLANSDRMHIKTLKRLLELTKAGITLVGKKPEGPLSLMEREEKSDVFAKLVNTLWGDGLKPNQVGSGWVIPENHCSKQLLIKNIKPDLMINELEQYRFIHRKVGADDLYFIYNPEGKAVTLNCSFRIANRVPELWSADSGDIERLGQFSQINGRTDCALQLDPHESVFVVFRSSSKNVDPVVNLTPSTAKVLFSENRGMELHADQKGTYEIQRVSGLIQNVHVTDLQKPLMITNSWAAQFDGVGLTGPKVLNFENLTDWTDHERKDIKHFSGTAAYRTSFNLSDKWNLSGKRVYLDLGRVEIAAEVILNGQNVGILWKPPFVIDVTDQVVKGENKLEVHVTNLWTNRLIGDEKLKNTSGYSTKLKMPSWYTNNEPMPDGPRSTFSTFNFYGKDRTLLPSGLLGPVLLRQEAITPISK